MQFCKSGFVKLIMCASCVFPSCLFLCAFYSSSFFLILFSFGVLIQCVQTSMFKAFMFKILPHAAFDEKH